MENKLQKFTGFTTVIGSHALWLDGPLEGGTRVPGAAELEELEGSGGDVGGNAGGEGVVGFLEAVKFDHGNLGPPQGQSHPALFQPLQPSHQHQTQPSNSK